MPSKTKKDVFRALSKNLELDGASVELVPTTATLAIVKNLIAQPKTSWEYRLALAASWPPLEESELVKLASKEKCYLWVFPPSHRDETSCATLDEFNGSLKAPRAVMGMGFSIITDGWTTTPLCAEKRPYTAFIRLLSHGIRGREDGA